MSIIRVKKTKDFTVLHNHIFKNNQLSARAIGVYCYCMSLPDDWSFNKAEIFTHFKEGRDSLSKAWNELKDNGFIVKNISKSKSGKFSGVDWIFNELPDSNRTTENQSNGNHNTENHRTGNQLTDNPPLLNTKEPNTNILNTDNTKNEKIKKESPSKPITEMLYKWRIANGTWDGSVKETNLMFNSGKKLLEKMIDTDGIPMVMKIFEWAMKDGFWKGVALNPHHYTKIKASMQRSKPLSEGSQVPS